jgi:hypothetical protein
MSGFEPMMIGAALGAATNRRNPLQGAMLGGVLGGFGGAAMGAGNTAATAAMKGATMPTVGTGVTAGAALPAAQGVAATAPFATATMPTYAATGGTTGLIGSTTAPVTMMDRLGAMGSFAKENPMAVGVGLQSANSLLTPPEPLPMAPPPNLMRGQQFQTEQPMYGMAPQQPISLI